MGALLLVFKEKHSSSGLHLTYQTETFHWTCQSLQGGGGSSTGMGKLRTVLCTLGGAISGSIPLCASGSCTERCSPKYKQLLLPSPPGTELEMTTQEVCLHRCKVSHAFIFSCGFYKIRGIKQKRQQLEAPEIVCIKKPPILCYVSKACARFQLPKSI